MKSSVSQRRKISIYREPSAGTLEFWYCSVLWGSISLRYTGTCDRMRHDPAITLAPIWDREVSAASTYQMISLEPSPVTTKDW